MKTLIGQIKDFIEEKIEAGYKKFIIFPYGDVGIQVKHILNDVYGIKEEYILDNHICRYNPQVKPLSLLGETGCEGCCLLLSSTNPDIYIDLKREAQKYFPDHAIAELVCMMDGVTYIGRYSYGPICRNHALIESIGAFCSFAIGTEVVLNHEMNYLTTHPLIYTGANEYIYKDFKRYAKYDFYFEGVQPKREKLKIAKRIRIGNDVWLGHNVLITNYSNIGNGVIAGAGAVITKDVPDYAVVAGVPAKIIRYRYTPTQIDALNRIAWWNWSDDDIRARYDDFYLPIEQFIQKYI